MTKLDLIDTQLARLHEQQTRISERLFSCHDNEDLPDFGVTELDRIQTQISMLIQSLKQEKDFVAEDTWGL